ncbi:uncharacterized protein LOC116589876 [Mustela erminea]|uniref:uncharacterized protein LOC116589876 n=1 Tax=Mustela erminea TaxID=36723 RepID=UPI0013874230|nr:uncharacterized protein LOC116589876 [Mustela erminea]
MCACACVHARVYTHVASGARTVETVVTTWNGQDRRPCREEHEVEGGIPGGEKQVPAGVWSQDGHHHWGPRETSCLGPQVAGLSTTGRCWPSGGHKPPPQRTPAFLLGVSAATCAACSELTSLVSTDDDGRKGLTRQRGKPAGGTLFTLPPEHSNALGWDVPKGLPSSGVSPPGPPTWGCLCGLAGGGVLFLLEHEDTHRLAGLGQ